VFSSSVVKICNCAYKGPNDIELRLYSISYAMNGLCERNIFIKVSVDIGRVPAKKEN